MVHNLLNSQPKELKALHNGEYHTFYDDEADLAGLVMQAVLKADVDARKELLGNIVVVGGGALTDGVVPRLQSDLAGILPNHIKVNGTSVSIDS
jgi:actin-related protein